MAKNGHRQTSAPLLAADKSPVGTEYRDGGILSGERHKRTAVSSE